MIGAIELAVLAAAGYRATQLVVHDAILQAPRDAVFDWHAQDPGSPARTAIATLISCVYCIGWWISGAILAAYLTATGTWDNAPLAVHGIEWFAVAGAAVLANRWDDTRPEAAAS